MGKTIISLRADEEDIVLAKSQKINISEFFRHCLKAKLYSELNIDENDLEKVIQQQRMKIAGLIKESELEAKEKEKLKKEIKNLLGEER